MDTRIPITQLRAQIGTLIKRLRENPNLVFCITHHGEVVADLRAPGSAAADATTTTQAEIGDFIEAYLQGMQPRANNPYALLRELGSIPAEQLPYDDVEDAMRAIRGRADGSDRL